MRKLFRRGATLMELLSCTFLLGLLLGAVGSILFYSQAYLNSLEARLMLQSEGLKVSQRAVAELGQSAFETLDIVPGAVSYASLLDQTGGSRAVAGQYVWQSRRVLMHDKAENSLVRLVAPLSGPASPDPPTPQRVLDVWSLAGMKSKIGSNLTRFDLTAQKLEGAAAPNYLKIDMRFDLVYYRKKLWVELHTGCYLRNSENS